MTKKTIKLFWWRLEGSRNGNFGDEITQLLIKKIFHKKVIWSPPDTCDIIGAGSILTEVYENKKDNKPFVWSSGFIEDDKTTIDASAFKFCSVRGNSTLKRINDIDEVVSIGDAGLLASYLLPKYYHLLPMRRYKLGIIPHYIDADSNLIAKLKNHPDVLIINAKWTCKKVIKSIYKCNAIASSSLHGLIISDSLNVPNTHITLSDKLKGGNYKFYDYYSVFDKDRYHPMDIGVLETNDVNEISNYIKINYIPPYNLAEIKKTIIKAFPFA